jgi:hypothetical protein
MLPRPSRPGHHDIQKVPSLCDPELVAAGRYRVSCVRARFDTRRKTHPVAEEVFVIRRTDLLPVAARYYPNKRTFRIQPFLLQNELPIADCPALVYTLGARAYRPLAPANLAVNGDGHAPTYGTGANIVASWTLTDENRPLVPVTDVLTPTIPKTVLEVLDLAGTLKGTFVFAGATSPRTITNAQLVAALGSETSFELRAWFQRNGYRSLEFDTVKVTKI